MTTAITVTECLIESLANDRWDDRRRNPTNHLEYRMDGGAASTWPPSAVSPQRALDMSYFRPELKSKASRMQLDRTFGPNEACPGPAATGTVVRPALSNA